MFSTNQKIHTWAQYNSHTASTLHTMYDVVCIYIYTLGNGAKQD